jgi:ABC-2 type transport system permease protein
MSDLWTIIWKESKDFLYSGGLSDTVRPLIIIGVLGVVMPLTLKQRWINLDTNAFLIILLIPFMLITTSISDAIAGERERHTLETLLASRVSDRAILLGKVLVAVGFHWGITLFCLLLGAILVNLTRGQGQWEFYMPTDRFLVLLVLNILTLLLAASSGVLISLKSATVRQAAQTQILGLVILGLAIYLVIRLLPVSLIASLTTSQIVLIVMGVLVLLDAILLAASLASFRRSRLILG